MFAYRSMESAPRPDGRDRLGEREEAGEALHRLYVAFDLGPESLLPDPQLLVGPEPLGGTRVERLAKVEELGNISCFTGLEPYAPSRPWRPGR